MILTDKFKMKVFIWKKEKLKQVSTLLIHDIVKLLTKILNSKLSKMKCLQKY